MSMETYIAATRFGFGVRPDEAGQGARWLLEQIRAPQMVGSSFTSLLTSQGLLRETFELKAKREEQKKNGADEPVKVKQVLKETFVSEMDARIQLAMTTTTPFYERLVDFWSNHFSVSAKKAFLLGVVGAFEREAIRPYVTGRFSDMLLAVVRHPVMLTYLDNARSIGPDSMAGERSGKGLNENLAREIMELHTLGVDGGYRQEDVTTFAKIITGWSIAGPKSDSPGLFEFAPRRHEPGTQTILGKQYADNGQEQGIDVLHDLANHPATAHHIAFKLARHFIADAPPEACVEKLTNVFLRSGGALADVYEALVAMPEAWDAVRNPKIKSSYDLVVSSMRLVSGGEENIMAYCLKSLKFLGNLPFTAESPAGFPDTAQELVGPESLMRRVEWAQMTARRFTFLQPAAKLAESVVGPVLSGGTRSAIAGAENETEAMAILLGSPEFQRR